MLTAVDRTHEPFACETLYGKWKCGPQSHCMESRCLYYYFFFFACSFVLNGIGRTEPLDGVKTKKKKLHKSCVYWVHLYVSISLSLERKKHKYTTRTAANNNQTTQLPMMTTRIHLQNIWNFARTSPYGWTRSWDSGAHYRPTYMREKFRHVIEILKLHRIWREAVYFRYPTYRYLLILLRLEFCSLLTQTTADGLTSDAGATFCALHDVVDPHVSIPTAFRWNVIKFK